MSKSKIPLTDKGFPRDAWELLSPKLTEGRREKMFEVASKRTDHIRLIAENIYDPHNVSACLRSAEALGVLNIDFVNTYQEFARPTTVSKGSYNWLDLHRHDDIKATADKLHSQGYMIAAGYPHPDCMKLDEIPVDKPVAVLFGNEHQGVSADWDAHVDYKFTIPMVGMVESLNISVSAALSMYELTKNAQKLLGDEKYQLSQERREEILSNWVCRHSRNYELELERLREKK